VLSSKGLWIDVTQTSQGSGFKQDVSSTDQKYSWQAIFACQIGIRPFKELAALKWGFNLAALLDEALDRQKLFIESQLLNNPVDVQFVQRTLALRCICIPKTGLRLGLIAKILAETQEQAEISAQNYCREIVSIFPYDYTIHPASSIEEFNQITGNEIFQKCNNQNSIAQIRRYESPVRTTNGIFRMLGRWQTEVRSDDQIWRALAGYQNKLLLNIMVRPTTLFEGERRVLLKMKQSAEMSQNSGADEPYLQHYEEWIDAFISRHTSPWNRYFYLQVHLASPIEIDEHIIRSIGSATTREKQEQPSPGFQVVYPLDKNNAIEWCKNLNCLEIIQTNNSFLLPRLSELASLEEVHAVFRLPYPPESGLLNTEFLNARSE
jgi:hypothetical protein